MRNYYKNRIPIATGKLCKAEQGYRLLQPRPCSSIKLQLPSRNLHTLLVTTTHIIIVVRLYHWHEKYGY